MSKDQLLEAIMSSDSDAISEEIRKHSFKTHKTDYLNVAVASKQYDIAAKLLKAKFSILDSDVLRLIRDGKSELVDLVIANKSYDTYKTDYLNVAVASKQYDIAAKLLKAKFSILDSDVKILIRNGKSELVDLVIANKSYETHKTDYLNVAVASKQYDIAAKLLKAKFSILDSDVLRLIRDGKSELIGLVVRNNPYQTYETEYLKEALKYNQFEIAKTLITAGHKLEYNDLATILQSDNQEKIKWIKENVDLKQYLDDVIYRQNKDGLELLVSKGGVKLNDEHARQAVYSGAVNMLDHINKVHPIADIKDVQGNNLLLQASSKDMMNKLIELGVDINARNKAGENVLEARMRSTIGLDSAKALIDSGIDTTKIRSRYNSQAVIPEYTMGPKDQYFPNSFSHYSSNNAIIEYAVLHDPSTSPQDKEALVANIAQRLTDGLEKYKREEKQSPGNVGWNYKQKFVEQIKDIAKDFDNGTREQAEKLADEILEQSNRSPFQKIVNFIKEKILGKEVKRTTQQDVAQFVGDLVLRTTVAEPAHKRAKVELIDRQHSLVVTDAQQLGTTEKIAPQPEPQMAQPVERAVIPVVASNITDGRKIVSGGVIKPEDAKAESSLPVYDPTKGKSSQTLSPSKVAQGKRKALENGSSTRAVQLYGQELDPPMSERRKPFEPSKSRN